MKFLSFVLFALFLIFISSCASTANRQNNLRKTFIECTKCKSSNHSVKPVIEGYNFVGRFDSGSYQFNCGDNSYNCLMWFDSISGFKSKCAIKE